MLLDHAGAPQVCGLAEEMLRGPVDGGNSLDGFPTAPSIPLASQEFLGPVVFL